ncbi:MAG: hypothetical protein IJN50_04950 [Clostridia bacterium]|nr:hypothetical protein [Clostridia bacterium]
MIKTNLKNKIIIITLLILLFIGVLSNITKEVFAANKFLPQGYTDDDGDGNYEIEHEADIDDLDIGDTVKVRKGVLTLNKNVFCVQHGQALPGDLATYKVKEQYTITAEGINKKNSSGSTFISVAENSDLVNFAQGIAYILQLDNEWDGDVNSQAPSDASPAQRILWKYLDKATKEYCNAVGMDPSKPGSTTVTLKAGEQKLFNTAMKLWKGDSYTETNFDSNALKRAYKAEYYTFANTSDDTQKLILLKSTSDVVKDNKKIQITINKTDAYDSTTKLNASFDVIFKQGDNTEKKSLNTPGGSGSTTVEMKGEEDVVTVTIKETKTEGGYLLLTGTEGITLTFKYKDHQWKLETWNVPSADSSLVTISGKETNTVTLNVKNEINREFSLHLDKESSIGEPGTNHGDLIDGTEFQFNFYFIKEFRILGKYLPSFNNIPVVRDTEYIVEVDGLKWIVKNSDGEKIGETDNHKLIVDGGCIKVNKFTPSPNFWGEERKSVYISIKETEASEGYDIINRTIFMAVNLKDKDNIKITEYVYANDVKKELKDLYEMFKDSGKIEVQGITRLEKATSETKQEINEVSVKSGNTLYLKLTNKKLVTIKGKVWQDSQTGLKSSTEPNGKIDTNENAMSGINVYLCRKKGSWLGDNWEELISDVIVAETKTDSNGNYEFKNMEHLTNLYVAFEYDGINYIETVGAGFGTRGNDSDAEEKAVNLKHDGLWYYKYDNTEKKFIKTTFDGTELEVKSTPRSIFNSKFVIIDNQGAHQVLTYATIQGIWEVITGDGDAATKIATIESILSGVPRITEIINQVKKYFNGELNGDELKSAILAIMTDSSYENIIGLSYKDIDGFKSRLITKDSNGIKEEFKMYAVANTDKEPVANLETGEYELILNCGLVKREFDLDLSTNLETVKTTINGETADYKYSLDENNVLYLRAEGDESRPNKVGYNQKIYESDYNYNIGDYFDNTGDFSVDNSSCVDKDLKDDEAAILGTSELEIYVTYRVQITNQTNKKAYVFGIKDYYSTNLEFDSMEYDSSKLMIKKTDIKEEKTINDGKYYTLNLDIDSVGSNHIENSEAIYLTFKVKKYDAEGNLTDAWKNIGNGSGLNINHIAEITSYGSDEGYIDMNSAPGNAIQGTSVRFEDDTDEAGKLTVKVDENKERTLSGIVWDDQNKNGKYDSGETLIDGVTVQLIELREVNGITLEYIWQETKTGNNKLDRVNISGTGIENPPVNNGVTAGSGEFKFVGYIPGNYIVRYKYGLDGGKYNGNDYKSTYDRTGTSGNAGTRYKGISQLNLTENERFSDAYDNEARRLEEMSIFAGLTVDSTTSLNLEKHWMCADTNKFEICLEDPKSYAIENSKQTVNAQETIDNCIINNVDFGLMERPKTGVSLEKHLTALSIDVAGEGKILDAKFNIDKFYTDTTINGDWNQYEKCIEGIKANLSTIHSNIEERGFWKFETDVNELINGAELTAEYTYVVSNNSDEDYLSAQLMNAYEQLSKGETCQFIYEGETSEVTLIPGVITFEKLLNDPTDGLAQRTKTLIRLKKHTNGYYLGDHYYTGDANNIVDLKGGTSESELEGEGPLTNWKNKLAGVTVRINKIEELVNKEFNFDEDINYSSYGPYNNFSQYKSTARTEDNKITPEHDFYKFDENTPTRTKITNTDLSNYALIQSKDCEVSLTPGERNYDRKIVLTKTLNTNNIKDMSFDSYNAEILSYSVASGRKAKDSTPGNMNIDRYSYTDDNAKILKEEGFESDEFWGETIIITAPTGNNTALWIILGVTCALIIAGGVFGIKKFVLKH